MEIQTAWRVRADLEDWLDRVEATLLGADHDSFEAYTERLTSDEGWVNPARTVTAWVTFDDPNPTLVAFTTYDDGNGDEIERWARRELDI